MLHAYVKYEVDLSICELKQKALSYDAYFVSLGKRARRSLLTTIAADIIGRLLLNAAHAVRHIENVQLLCEGVVISSVSVDNNAPLMLDHDGSREDMCAWLK